MGVSVVVRTKNEEKTVGKLFDILKKQTFKKIETVVVDNESTDKTLEVVERFSPDKIISIADTSFTHGYSLNRGIANSKGRLIILTNGHCVPISATQLEDGIKNLSNTKIAAIDGYYIDIKSKSNESTLEEKKRESQRWPRRENESISSTNAIIRKDLWEQYGFDESLPGCEDYDWWQEMIARDYGTIKDPRFTVFHLHSLIEEEYAGRKAFWEKTRRFINRKIRPYKKL